MYLVLAVAVTSLPRAVGNEACACCKALEGTVSAWVLVLPSMIHISFLLKT